MKTLILIIRILPNRSLMMIMMMMMIHISMYVKHTYFALTSKHGTRLILPTKLHGTSFLVKANKRFLILSIKNWNAHLPSLVLISALQTVRRFMKSRQKLRLLQTFLMILLISLTTRLYLSIILSPTSTPLPFHAYYHRIPLPSPNLIRRNLTRVIARSTPFSILFVLNARHPTT